METQLAAIRAKVAAGVQADWQRLEQARTALNQAGRFGQGRAQRELDAVRGQLANKYVDAGQPPAGRGGWSADQAWQQAALADGERRSGQSDPQTRLAQTTTEMARLEQLRAAAALAASEALTAEAFREGPRSAVADLQTRISRAPARAASAGKLIERINQEQNIRAATDQAVDAAKRAVELTEQAKTAEEERAGRISPSRRPGTGHSLDPTTMRPPGPERGHGRRR